MANDSAGICSMDNVKFLPELLFKYIETIPERNYYQIAYVPAGMWHSIAYAHVAQEIELEAKF
nr:hypothetical protein Iba_scaffold129695CG0010 [Ipomoea batatas]GMD61926.1 hypothetical protein Iba_chr12bCG0620 [Ipomoea batatas]